MASNRPFYRAALQVMMVLNAAPSARAVAEAAPPIPQLVVLGDSLSTGAATHPALAFDAGVLWDVFAGKVALTAKRVDLPLDFQGALPEALPPPVRLWPADREYFGGPDWVWRNALQALSRRYLDTAEYSWGYLTAVQLGVAPSLVALAGEDGARVNQLPRHIDRMLAATGGMLPARLFIFYTGNDLCAMDEEGITPAETYGQDLENGLNYLARLGQLGPGGSDVYLLSYLSVLQLLTSEEILNKKVRAFGSELTCRELRDHGYRPATAELAAKATLALPPEAWYFGMFMPPSPASFCATLFSPAPLAGGDSKGKSSKNSSHLLGVLANHLRAYREKEADLVAKLAAGKAGSEAAGLRLHFVPATAAINFVGADIAPDCFHLSVLGQAKIARVVSAAVREAGAK